MFSDLAQYVAPKRRAVDHSANDGTGHISISWLPANKKSTGGGRGSGGTQTRPVTIAIGRRDGKYIDLRAVERMQASHVPGGCHHLRSVARSFAMC
jgi:hypothetical protein